jgi:uncharacterized membrane protein (TIGR02234 family)
MADARERTGFAPVVVLGLAAAALTSVASAKPWFSASIDYRLMPGVRDPDKSADMPLALALSLVVLAGWGAVLVSRGRTRRIVLAIALLASVGVLACLVAAPFTLPDDIRGRLLTGSEDVAISPTAWFVVTAVAGAISVAALVAAWALLPRWPTMSSRYDAPGARADDAGAPEARTGTDLWKAFDEGQDPTDPTHAEDPPSP